MFFLPFRTIQKSLDPSCNASYPVKGEKRQQNFCPSCIILRIQRLEGETVLSQTSSLSFATLSANLNTVKPVLRVTPGTGKNWLLKTGDPLIQVHLHYILVQGTPKRWLLEAGDPLIQ